MPHQHWCDYLGHYYWCQGTATRLFASEPSVCMCLNCGTPMEQGQHSECSIELLSCPEHRADHMRAMGYEPGYTEEPRTSESEPSQMFTDKDGNHIVGFCLWCDKDFYSMAEVEDHNANDMANCPVSQELKDEHCMPPVLQVMPEEAGLLDDEGTGNRK